jgi:hypothetical protein
MWRVGGSAIAQAACGKRNEVQPDIPSHPSLELIKREEEAGGRSIRRDIRSTMSSRPAVGGKPPSHPTTKRKSE